MRTHFRVASILAIALWLFTTSPALAKGSFMFLTVSGESLPADLYITDPALTADFFGFADFVHNKASEPANPGMGYEIIRYYVDRGRPQPFDHLHYYPSTGYVYYDGIVNGSSEYDGKWYTAQPEMRTPFEKAVLRASIPAELRQRTLDRRS